jgi:hypothetical protein
MEYVVVQDGASRNSTATASRLALLMQVGALLWANLPMFKLLSLVK